MITTARVARFLQSLPDDDATAILDTVSQVAADPAALSPRCRRLASNLYEARHTLPHRRQARVMFGFRDGEPVLLTAFLKKDTKRHTAAIMHAASEMSS
jgi:hypothetical protein